MPPSEEELAAAGANIRELATMHAAHCVFRYSQAEELKKTWTYRKSHGVCFGMSFDWLRRKLHNIHNSEARPKRYFDDPKYKNSKRKRVHLTQKHGKLQDAYKQGLATLPFGQRNTRNGLTAMVAASVVSSALDRLTVSQSVVVHSYQLNTDAANAHMTMRRSLDEAIANAEHLLADDNPAVGILFHMQGATGHATALLLTGRDIRFFDPNVGEYMFHRNTERLKLLQLVSALWFDVYHLFMQMDSLQFETIQYAGEDAGDGD
jgi:hypothetical protein